MGFLPAHRSDALDAGKRCMALVIPDTAQLSQQCQLLSDLVTRQSLYIFSTRPAAVHSILKHAAYCYRWSVVGVSVGHNVSCARTAEHNLSRCHLGCGLVGPMNHVEARIPRGKGQFWRLGVVVSGVRRMNEVNARRARLVPGWVTVFGRVYHLGI